MVLMVDISGTRYLCDVGFGVATLTMPLRLKADSEQATPHETFRLTGGDPAWRMEIRIGDEWRAVYSVETDEKTFDDYVRLNDAMQSDPNFRENLIAARTDRGRRITLRNRELRIHQTGGETERRALATVAEVREALTNLFGIALPVSEKLDPAIERVLARPPS
jgi:N-hydroxyarylamine O-acetyltransferase